MNDLTYYESLLSVMLAFISGAGAVLTNNYYFIIIIVIPFLISISKNKKEVKTK